MASASTDLSSLQAYVTGVNGSLVLLPALGPSSGQQGHAQGLPQQSSVMAELDGSSVAQLLVQQLGRTGAGNLQLAANGSISLPLSHQDGKADAPAGGQGQDITLQRLLHLLSGNAGGPSNLLSLASGAPLSMAQPPISLSLLQQHQHQLPEQHTGHGHRRSHSQQSPSGSESQSPPPSGPGKADGNAHHHNHHGVTKVTAKEKNRMAQRRFRERQKDLITNLKHKAEALEAKVLSDAKLIKELSDENVLLKAKLEAYAALVQANLAAAPEQSMAKGHGQDGHNGRGLLELQHR